MEDEWLGKNPDFSDIDPQFLEEYKIFMEENFRVILLHKRSFIMDSYFSNVFKIERIDELIDFFLLEEEYEKCSELSRIRDILELKVVVQEYKK